MARFLFALVVLFAGVAHATRTEVAPPGLNGPTRFFYDTDDRAFGVEVEQTDRFWVNRHGYDGRALGIYMYEPFEEGDDKGLGILAFDGSAFAGTTAEANTLFLPRGNRLECYAKGAGQTLPPDMDAGGLDIGGDQTDDEGYECASHVGTATGSPFVIGTSPAFYFKVSILVGDADGTDDLHCGIRKIEATEANFDDYTDFVSLGVNTAASPMAIKIETANDDAATTSTDTTDTVAEDIVYTMKFLVSAAGVVTYQHDADTLGTLEAPDATAAYTFDDGDLVHPFCWYINSANIADEVVISEWEVDLQ
jgi:hypothetical protein